MSSPITHLTPWASGPTRAARAARAGENFVRGMRSLVDSSPASSRHAGRPASGWIAVTVSSELSDVMGSELPAPLAELGEEIEVRIQRAPGGRGTEVAIRPRGLTPSGTTPSRLSGTDPLGQLRAALREAKQLIEVGQVLRVDPVPHGERTATPGGALLQAWTKVAPRGGVR